MKIHIVFLFCTLICISCKQVRLVAYSISGTYEKHSAQGMAVWDNYAVLLNDQGLCRIYSLDRKELAGSYRLGSFHKNNHANCASFGVEYPEGNMTFPALYVSECRRPYRCFVENVNLDSAKVIQTLQYQAAGGEAQVVHDWIVDCEERKLYGVSRLLVPDGNKASDSLRIIRFPLPLLSDGNVTLTAKDVEEQFHIYLPNLLQGGSIRKGILYLPVGLHTGNEHRKDAERAIVMVNLKRQQVTHILNLQEKLMNEPEDVDFHGKHLLLFCGQTGGIYQIKH